VTERTKAKHNKKLAMDWEAVRLRLSENMRTTFWQKESSEGRILKWKLNQGYVFSRLLKFIFRVVTEVLQAGYP
jgi:hypothetical protein